MSARNLSALDGWDAKVVVGRELTDSNSGSVWAAECSVSNATGAEQALITNRGGRFQIPTFSRRPVRWTSDLENRSTVLFRALKRGTRLNQFQLAGAF